MKIILKKIKINKKDKNLKLSNRYFLIQIYSTKIQVEITTKDLNSKMIYFYSLQIFVHESFCFFLFVCFADVHEKLNIQSPSSIMQRMQSSQKEIYFFFNFKSLPFYLDEFVI